MIRVLGAPGAFVVVVAYTLRKIVTWAMPHAEAMAKAWMSRQQTMEQCQKDLTEQTIAIQKQALEQLDQVRESLAGVCKANCEQKDWRRGHG